MTQPENPVVGQIPRPSRLYTFIDEPREFIQVSLFDAPWPVRDRIFISHISLEVDRATGRARVEYGPSGYEEEVRGAILGSAVGTHYVLEPLDGEITLRNNRAA